MCYYRAKNGELWNVRLNVMIIVVKQHSFFYHSENLLPKITNFNLFYTDDAVKSALNLWRNTFGHGFNVTTH